MRRHSTRGEVEQALITAPERRPKASAWKRRLKAIVPPDVAILDTHSLVRRWIRAERGSASGHPDGSVIWVASPKILKPMLKFAEPGDVRRRVRRGDRAQHVSGFF